jgi:Y-X(10)_GDL-associated radical SAM protein
VHMTDDLQISAPDTRQFARELSTDDLEGFVPVHVVWEVTLACDLKCLHCGSRAGHRRPNELSTSECFEVIDQLAKLGTREISLIGGEAYLRRDWTKLVERIRSHGIYCAIQSGARTFTKERLNAGAEAGLQGLGVSLDGLEALHDMLRGVRGSYALALDALRTAKSLGLNTSVNTQIGASVVPDLPLLLDVILDAGVRHWKVQITVAMGNAADRPELLLQPYRLLELMPLLDELRKKGAENGLLLQLGNNVGYFGPFERHWRGLGDQRVHWSGCGAGNNILALEADGTVKACPSLATSHFAAGNVRDLDLEGIWKSSSSLHFNRERGTDEMWGLCKSCYYAPVCRGGCTWTSHSLLGRPGNNPYCFFRARGLARQGLRERIVKCKDAAPQPFAVGEFEILLETLDGEIAEHANLADHVNPTPGGWMPKRNTPPEIGRLPQQLVLCHVCDEYVWPHETECPHCGTDLRHREEIARDDMNRRAALIVRTRELMSLIEALSTVAGS